MYYSNLFFASSARLVTSNRSSYWFSCLVLQSRLQFLHAAVHQVTCGMYGDAIAREETAESDDEKVKGAILYPIQTAGYTVCQQSAPTWRLLKLLYEVIDVAIEWQSITARNAVLNILVTYRVFQKSSSPKTFRNIFISVKSFCAKFCKFVGNSYPHLSTNFCRFILMFHQMALIFPRVPIVFTLSSFEYSPIKCKRSVSASEMMLIFRHHVS